MPIDFSKISPYKQRLELFQDSDILCRLDRAKASVLSPKAKDCQRQLNEASSVWAIDGKRFLVIFSNETDSNAHQKASVWAMKAPGNYLRLKTVWTSCRDYVFEAIVLFLTEYFELFILTATYTTDVSMFHDIESKLKEAARYTPSHLKQKVKLLKAWTDIMPRLNDMVASLDERIRNEASEVMDVKVNAQFSNSNFRMKAFFPAKAVPYYFNDTFTIAVRKECVEFYRKLRKGHALANVEVFSNMVRISVGCGGFADDLFGKVAAEGIDMEAHPKLVELLDDNCRYNILTDHSGSKTETRIFIEIDKGFRSWPEAIADPETNKEIRDIISFCLELYNELVKSTVPAIKAFANHFYD